jgi:two-component system, sensor histidine kinase and response regulator
LYIAQNIITRHKGSIGVESKVGEGSEFYFFLPYDGK